MIRKAVLKDLYIRQRLSSESVAKRLRCSQHRVNYWLAKHGIQKRSVSDALYLKWNPNGNPFIVRAPKTVQEGILYGLGIGLYWGEGTKSNKLSVRLGNSDPALIKKFIEFLVAFYQIDKSRLRFGLQIFGDMEAREAQRHWTRFLGISKKQFYPSIVITPYRGIGNYRVKTKYGVLTVYFNNKKLRDILCNAIEEVAHKPM